MLHIWNLHNTVHQIYLNLKNFFKDRNTQTSGSMIAPRAADLRLALPQLSTAQTLEPGWKISGVSHQLPGSSWSNLPPNMATNYSLMMSFCDFPASSKLTGPLTSHPVSQISGLEVEAPGPSYLTLCNTIKGKCAQPKCSTTQEQKWVNEAS